MIRRVLLDAGPWFAYYNQADQWHTWAVEVFKQFTQFHSCEPVLTEVCHRLAYYGMNQALPLE